MQNGYEGNTPPSGERGAVVIKTSPNDNVAIVANPTGLKRGAIVLTGIVLEEDIPMGHKVALQTLKEGEAVIRYGQIIGFANQTIEKGSWINENNISLPQPPKLEDIPYTKKDFPIPAPLEGYTFQGYKNADGSAKQLSFFHKDGNSKNNAYSNIGVTWVDEPTKQKYLYADSDFRLEKAKKTMTEKQKASIKLLPTWAPGLDLNKWRWLKVESSGDNFSKKDSGRDEADADIKKWVDETKLVSFLNDATNEKMYIRFRKIKNNEVFERKYPLGDYKLKQLEQFFKNWKRSFATPE